MGFYISLSRRLSGKEHSLNAPIGEDGDQWQDWLVDKEMDQELKFAQKEEIEFTSKDIKPDAVKIGMLHSANVIKAVIKSLNI